MSVDTVNEAASAQANASVATSSVRGATMDDVDGIYALLDEYARRGQLLPRTKAEIRRNIRDFFVIGSNPVLACGAIEIFTKDLGEVRSLVVKPEHAGTGLGRALVEHIIADANRLGLTRLMSLTYEPEFFNRLGFDVVSKDTLPEKVWGVCVSCYKFNDCDEIAMVRTLKS